MGTIYRNLSPHPLKKGNNTGGLSGDEGEAYTPEPTTTQEPLVGSQKRKARKTKITHLVRTADGRVSPAGGTLGKKRKCLDRKDQSKQGTIVASVARK